MFEGKDEIKDYPSWTKIMHSNALDIFGCQRPCFGHFRQSTAVLTDQRPVLAVKAPALPCKPLYLGAPTSECTLTRAPSHSMLVEPVSMGRSALEIMLLAAQ